MMNRIGTKRVSATFATTHVCPVSTVCVRTTGGLAHETAAL
jgi:hypothetical protein